MKHRDYLPVMLDVAGRPCVVVGGGRVAERKVDALLQAGAHVTVVSPQLSPRLEALAAQGLIQSHRDLYQAGLPALAAARLVFAATDDAAVNRAVRLEAEARGQLVSVADDPEASAFVLPAVVRRGRLTLAVSTAGASPSVAAAVRRQLEETFGLEYEAYLDLLHELRLAVQEALPDSGQRQQLFRGMLDWPLLALLRDGRFGGREREELRKRTLSARTPEDIERLGSWLGSLRQ